MATIIEPQDLKAKPPLKRSTVGAILVICVGLMAFGAYMTGAGTPKKVQKPNDGPVVEEPRSGTARAIADEFGAVKPDPVAKQGPLPAPLPLPSSNRRSDSTMAGVENKFDPEEEKRKALAQREAEARTSKSMVLNRASKSAPDGEASSSEDGPIVRDGENTARDESDQAVHDRIRLEAQQRVQKYQQQTSPAPAPRPQGDPNLAWRSQLAQEEAARALQPKRIYGKYVLAQGKIIPSVLMRNLNSDLPGEVVAMTSVDVYDSFHGGHLLIPKGSTMVGAYSSNVANGQERIMFAFKRLIMPNGLTFDLPGATGMDGSGTAGISGDVDNHFFKMFASSFLVAFLADKVERNAPATQQASGSSDIPGIMTGAATSGAKTAAGQVLVDVSRTILQRNRSIPPTITVDAGERLNVQVVADMQFPAPYRGHR